MKPVFPPEIINLSVERHFYKFSKSSNRIYLITLLFLIGIVISLFFIKTEISVQSSGLIRSVSESIDVTSPVVAEVLKTNVSENKYVHKGDTLVWLNYEKQTENIKHIKKLISRNAGFQDDLKSMYSQTSPSPKTNLYKSVYAKYKQQLIDYQVQIDILQKTYNRTKLLFDKKIVPLVDKENDEYELKKVIEERNVYREQCKNEWQQLASDYKQTNDDYYNQINELQKDFKSYVITSPCSGHIINYDGTQSGSFVTTGQTIATISPDDNLISEHYVAPKDIGYLRKGMPVIFQVAAYNYNQWGLASGQIIDISDEVYVVDSQPYFKVRCSVNEQYLSLKNGFKGYLKKGLTTTARFQVTKRTLAQLLFDKADDWLNPKLID